MKNVCTTPTRQSGRGKNTNSSELGKPEEQAPASSLDEGWFEKCEWFVPDRKIPVSIRLDSEIVEWFKAQGPGYLSRMNAVLKAYVKAHK